MSGVMVRHRDLPHGAVDLRALARESDVGCLIRVPAVCEWGPTCLCHVREAGVAGTGEKPPDFCGVIGCDACHAVLDGRARVRGISKQDVRVLALHALVRTLAYYDRLGMRLFGREG